MTSLLYLLLLMNGFALPPAKVDGIWLGALDAGGQKLRIQLHVQSDASGKLTTVLDSIDQGAAGIPCENAKLAGNQFSFEVPAVKGSWTGTLSDDGNELQGTWSQAGSITLNLARQSSAVSMAKPKPKYDDAKPPITLDQLKEVMDADLAQELKSGSLSAASEGGVVIGVVQHGKRRILTYGPVQEDSLFEIGSISKTFTGLILARMVAQGKVSLNQPLRDFLPPGTAAKPAGAEITLLDLATQHSGLPRLPDNLAPANMSDPYTDYSAQKLYDFLKKHGVAKPDHTEFLYSNLGFGTLGQALANQAGLSYADLLKREVTDPLGLKDTAVKLSAGQEKRFTPGHNGMNKVVPGWTFDAVAGAGAIRSTAADMLTYLEAQLHPSQAMQTAIQSTHELRDDALPGMKIGLAWLFISKTKSYWHNGGTGGYSSYALFSPAEDYCLIVLYNHTITNEGSFADRLGEHLAERLSGRPALILQ